MPVWRTVADLRAQTRAWRAAGDTIALVPTMGALHAGHLALVEEGRRRAIRTIASIFVNPAQFAPTEDFAAYPRTLESDLDKLAEAGAAGCFAPDASEMYGPAFATTVTLGGPALAKLDDRFRPTHFAGVATVVAKLFCQATPDCAVFGEKDYQQLMVVRRLARDLDIPVEVVGLPTVREADGLALSSRNVYLGAHERQVAPVLFATLQRVSRQIRDGEDVGVCLTAAREAITQAGFELDYLEARHAQTLAPVSAVGDGPIRLLLAAKIGRTRLIDNIGV